MKNLTQWIFEGHNISMCNYDCVQDFLLCITHITYLKKPTKISNPRVEVDTTTQRLPPLRYVYRGRAAEKNGIKLSTVTRRKQVAPPKS